jgi:hypothetical protein
VSCCWANSTSAEKNSPVHGRRSKKNKEGKNKACGNSKMGKTKNSKIMGEKKIEQIILFGE